jgi:hypothetical protein
VGGGLSSNRNTDGYGEKTLREQRSRKSGSGSVCGCGGGRWGQVDSEEAAEFVYFQGGPNRIRWLMG